jgi:predicted nucleic acid-binding protein
MTQLGFIRISSNSKIIPAAVRPQDAVSLLRRILQLPGHHFWPDDVETVSSEEFSSIALTGHRQVTDAHLLALSKRHDGKLATFDRGISTLLGSSKPVDRHIELIDVR